MKQAHGRAGGAMEECGDSIVLWPDNEGCDLRCTRPLGHPGRHQEGDGSMGSWGDDGIDSHSWDAVIAQCKADT